MQDGCPPNLHAHFLNKLVNTAGLRRSFVTSVGIPSPIFFFACSIVNIKCHGTCWCLEYCCFWSPKHSCDGTLECQLYCNSANESYLTLDLVTLGNCWWLCFSVCWVPSSLDITNKASWPCSSSTFTGQVDIFFNLLISMFALNPWPGFRSL